MLDDYELHLPTYIITAIIDEVDYEDEREKTREDKVDLAG